jgi:hypothetical protein
VTGFDSSLTATNIRSHFGTDASAHPFTPRVSGAFSARAHRNFNAFAKRFAKLDAAQIRALDQFDRWTALRSNGFKTDELIKRDLMDSTDFGESIRLTSAYTAAAEYIEKILPTRWTSRFAVATTGSSTP